jgi:non-specific serine/threonine protein kinase
VARLSCALWLFWLLRGYLGEGRRWMGPALAAAPSLPPIARARLRFVDATMAFAQADYAPVGGMMDEARRLFRAARDRRGEAYATGTAGLTTVGQGERERGLALLDQTVAIFREVGDVWGAAVLLVTAAVVPRSMPALQSLWQSRSVTGGTSEIDSWCILHPSHRISHGKDQRQQCRYEA